MFRSELRTIIARATEFRDALVSLLAPGRTWQLEPSLALCPNTSCEGAMWSERQFFRGPRIVEGTIDRHCERCGMILVRTCSGCRAPLSPNLADMVTTSSKREPDTTSAFCSRCGILLFRTPTCGSCGSFLTRPSMNCDTKTEGCDKCRPRRARAAPSRLHHPMMTSRSWARTERICHHQGCRRCAQPKFPALVRDNVDLQTVLGLKIVNHPDSVGPYQFDFTSARSNLRPRSASFWKRKTTSPPRAPGCKVSMPHSAS
jgi:hypothetical protein